MLLINIEKYKLYRYVTGYNKILNQNITFLKQLNRELIINESAFLENSENKIKKIDENKYMFQRFDTVSTHIEDYDSDYNLNNIKNKLIKKLNYKLKYAEDRVKSVNRLLEKNQWIYDLVSTKRFIQKEIKKKNSFKSEEQPFDKLMEIISSYINHAKFKNKQDEKEYNEKLKKLKLAEKNKKNENLDIDTLDKLITDVQSYHHRLIKRKIKEDKRQEQVSDLGERENKGDFLETEEQMHRQKKLKKGYKKDDISNYNWDEMGYSKKEQITRKETLKQMEKELKKLHKYIGLDIKDIKERKKYKKQVIKRIHTSLSKEHKKTFNGTRQFGIITDMYNQLKGDYEIAKKIVTNEIEFKRLTRDTTNYDINSDTWYEDIKLNVDIKESLQYLNKKNKINKIISPGFKLEKKAKKYFIIKSQIIELSKNHILLNDKNTYKGLILNYKDLKDKYRDKMNHDIWALLFVFEELLDKTEFTQDEKFVLDMLFDSFNQRQIREKYEKVNLSSLGQRRISNLINNVIPNKILNTYMNGVDDWLYTEKLKGNYKTCSKCREVKLANERYFNKDATRRDGLMYMCKDCEKVGN